MALKNRLAVIAASAALFSTYGAVADDGPGFVIYGGADVTESSLFGFAGVVSALNGNLGKEGPLVRVGGVVGQYDYNLPAGTVDADVSGIDVMLGYQNFVEGVRISGYGGYDYRHTDLSIADPSNSSEGNQSGVKAQLEITTVDTAPYYVSLIGSYSTRNDSYWTRGRAGYQFSSFVIGPEGLAMGDEGYNQIRYGAFTQFRIPFESVIGSDLALSVSGGYVDSSGTRGSSGPYGNASFSVTF